jgi:hypothetical protein
MVGFFFFFLVVARGGGGSVEDIEDSTPDSGIQMGNVRFLKREDNIEDADQTEELRLMIYAGKLYILVEERT